jgi:hypothetical protein
MRDLTIAKINQKKVKMINMKRWGKFDGMFAYQHARAMTGADGNMGGPTHPRKYLKCVFRSV